MPRNRRRKSRRLCLNDIKDPKLRQALISQIGRDSASYSASDVEPDIVGEPKRPDGHQKDGEICRIYVHSLRKRLVDSDGISIKALLDGIVDTKLLIDDSPSEVEWVRHTQEKIKKDEQEITIIRIDFYG